MNAFNDFGQIMSVICTDGGGLNVYNFRDFGNYDFSPVSVFMNSQFAIQKYNAAPGVTYATSSGSVYNGLAPNDFMSSVAVESVAFDINYIQVLLYNGQDDIICNSPSS